MRFRLLFSAILGASLLLLNSVEGNEQACCPHSNPCCEDEEGETHKKNRAWFRHSVSEDEEDPTHELEEDSSWAGQREEFSDMLFR